jgi:hypothetical protein
MSRTKADSLSMTFPKIRGWIERVKAQPEFVSIL